MRYMLSSLQNEVNVFLAKKIGLPILLAKGELFDSPFFSNDDVFLSLDIFSVENPYGRKYLKISKWELQVLSWKLDAMDAINSI